MAYEEALAALSDPTRRLVFGRILAAPRPVTAIAEGLPISRPAVSRHLTVLKEARLITERRSGTRRLCAANPQAFGELRVGGCFCERLKNGGSVQHLQVVYAASGEGLRLRGALGPLQAEGVDGTLSWTLKPAEGGTNVTLSYVVDGCIRGGMEQWAQRVDRVLDEQLQRVKGFVEADPQRKNPLWVQARPAGANRKW